jgi:hypothetical protein
MSEIVVDTAIRAVATIVTGGAAPLADALRTAFPSIDTVREKHEKFVENREKDVQRLTDYRRHLEGIGVRSEPVLIAAELGGKLHSSLTRTYSGAAKGTSDLFRLGDSMRDPSALNLLKDFGRATFVAESINGGLKAVVIPASKIVKGGGCFTCGYNAAANVINESAQASVGLDTLAALNKSTLGAIVSPSYRGLPGLRSVGGMLRAVGVRFETVGIRSTPGMKAAQSLEDLAAKSMQFKDPIAFGVVWKGLDSGSHAMAAINRGGLTYYVDQFGEFLLRGNGMNKVLECVRPFQQFGCGLRYAADQMEFVIPYAYRVYKVQPAVTGWGTFGFLNFQVPVEVVNLRELLNVALDISAKGSKELKRRVPPRPASRPRSVPQLHTIKTGDTLFGLARLQFGDAAQFNKIVEVNPFLAGTVPHHQLPVGQMILLP